MFIFLKSTLLTKFGNSNSNVVNYESSLFQQAMSKVKPETLFLYLIE
jgi:hypothetical protein